VVIVAIILCLLVDKRMDEVLDRRKGFRDSGRHFETLYFGMLIVIIYGVLSSLGWWIVENRLWVVLLVPFVYGVVTFVKKTSLRVQDSTYTRLREMIDDAQISLELDSDNLHPAAAKALAAVAAADKMSSNCSSPKGILKRARALQGTKTIIGFLNCGFFTASVVGSIWSARPVVACIQGLVVFLLCASLHVLYASWRELQGRTDWADSLQSQSAALKASFSQS